MNARTLRLRVLLAIGLLSGLTVGAAAQDYPEIRDRGPVRPIDDPVLTEPAVLSRGALLPGDNLPLACPADVDLAQPLSLADVVDLALCRSPQVQSAWADIKQQAAALGQAKAAYLPTLSASINKLHSETRYPDYPDSNLYQTGITNSANLTWRLFDFGAREANTRSAEQVLAAALASHDAALQKVLSGVVEAYFNAVSARASAQASDKAADLAQETTAAVRRREARGAAAVGDVLQASTALAKAKLAAQRASGDHRKAMAVLLYAMGVMPGAPVRLADETMPSETEALGELQQWLSQAEERHPAILAARAQWEAAKARVTATRDEGLPTLDITGNLYRNGYPNQGLQATRSTTTTIGLALTIPLFDGFAQQYKVKQAQALAEQGEAQLHDTEHQVLTEIVKAHSDAEAAVLNLDASQDLQRAAQESVDSAKNRYDKGAADVLELITVEQALADADQERVRCLAEWRSARLRLLANAGTLGLDWIRRDGVSSRVIEKQQASLGAP